MMGSSVASAAVKTLMGMMGLAVLGPMASTAEERAWKCGDSYVQPNVTLEDVLGDWYVWDLIGGPPAGCVKLSVTDLLEDSDCNKVMANLTIRHYFGIGPSPMVTTVKVYSFKDKPQEFIVPENRGVYRVRFLFRDGHVLILDGCKEISDINWTPIIVAMDRLSPNCKDLLPSSSLEMPSHTSSASNMTR